MYNKFLSYITKEEILAHIGNGKNETLLEHTLLTKSYYYKIVETKKMSQLLSNIFKKIDCENHTLISEMFSNAIIFHDLGKLNPSFQKEVLNNELEQYINASKYSSNHSLISAYIFICSYLKQIDNTFPKSENRKINKVLKKVKSKLKYIALCFGYCISKHHSTLGNDFFNDKDNFIKQLTTLDTFLKEDRYYISTLKDDFNFDLININHIEEENIEFMLLIKLLFSLLISCDYYATYTFMNNDNVETMGLIDRELKNEFLSLFNQNNIVSNIRNGIYNIPINELRNNIFLESELSLLNSMNNNLFFLEAPTGSGKTINSINLFLQTLKLNDDIQKVYYVFPYNTLGEQTYNSLLSFFPNQSNNICQINSITEIKEKESNYNKDYLNRIFMNYPISIISHVGFFNILFGTSKLNNFNFYDLANSVIILDEIQSYNINIWKEFINVLSVYSKLLNIKVIIMSATLPKLDLLIENCPNIVELLPNKHSYFQHPLFKNRVKLDFSLLKKPQSFSSLAKTLDKEITKSNKILFEFQNKKSCRDFYLFIKDNYKSHAIYELTGDDNLLYREKVINEFKKENEKIIIISTQIIEAGVDIDADLGFKEISLFESEEQFLGRINRSCTKSNCKAYFFTLVDSKVSLLYKGDIRLHFNLLTPYIQDVLLNKNFCDLYKKVITILDKERKKENINNYNVFLDECTQLCFKLIEERMQLITSDTIQIYINHNKLKDINALELWRKYTSLYNDFSISYAKKKIEMSKLYKSLNIFTFNIHNNDKFKLDKLKHINGIYFLENGDKYILDEGKLNRELLTEYLLA